MFEPGSHRIETCRGPVTMFICNPTASVEAALIAKNERDRVEWDRLEDLFREEQLARELDLYLENELPSEVVDAAAIGSWDFYREAVTVHDLKPQEIQDPWVEDVTRDWEGEQ